MMLGSLKRRRCLEAVSSSYMGISAIQCSWMPGIESETCVSLCTELS